MNSRMQYTVMQTIFAKWAIGFMWVLLSFPAYPCNATDIRLSFQNEEGETLHLSHAELLLIGWGLDERHPLVHSGTELSISFETEWIQQYWSYGMRNLDNLRILLQAEGYAPQLSMPLNWRHKTEQGQSPQRMLHFPGNDPVTIPEEAFLSIPVTFYRPQQRSLTLVGDHGERLHDVRLSVYMFWSAANHCGVFYRDFPIGTFTTNRDGQITLPHAGTYIEYLITVHEMYDYCFEPSFLNAWCSQTKVTLDTPHTLLTLHKFQKIHFDLIITKQGIIQDDLWVFGQQTSPCMFSGGVLGRPDPSSGVLHVECYPEKLIDVWIAPQEKEYRRHDVWHINIDALKHGHTFTIDVNDFEKGETIIPSMMGP